ncbi:MAG TPA: hypothetical protein ENK57_06455 [Polyangiaceae bacterium]|nr:hypothetical protein [Polyangiaceae bacterium]
MSAKTVITTIANGLIQFGRAHGQELTPIVRSFLKREGPRLEQLIQPHMVEAPPPAIDAEIDDWVDQAIAEGEL